MCARWYVWHITSCLHVWACLVHMCDIIYMCEQNVSFICVSMFSWHVWHNALYLCDMTPVRHSWHTMCRYCDIVSPFASWMCDDTQCVYDTFMTHNVRHCVTFCVFCWRHCRCILLNGSHVNEICVSCESVTCHHNVLSHVLHKHMYFINVIDTQCVHDTKCGDCHKWDKHCADMSLIHIRFIGMWFIDMWGICMHTICSHSDIWTWHINMTYQHDIWTWRMNMTYHHMSHNL